MTWFRLDDQGAFHAKVLAAGNEAYGAWCRAGQWSSAHGTDGEIPKHVALQIATMRVWKILLSVGLLEEDSEKTSSFFIHDFLDFNPSRAQVEARRQVRAANGSLGGKRRVLNESVKQTLEQEPSKHSSNKQVTAKPLLEPCSNPRPVPTRPDPNPEEPPISPPRGAPGQALSLNFGQSDEQTAVSIPAMDATRPEALETSADTLPKSEQVPTVKANVGATSGAVSDDTKSRTHGVSPKQRRATRWPNDFGLTAEMIVYATGRGMTGPAQVASEFERFENHHKSKGNRFVDWKLAFYTWVRNWEDRAKRNSPMRQQRTITNQTDASFLDTPEDQMPRGW